CGYPWPCESPGTILPASPHGAIAQLEERLDRTQEVAGSSPASSTRTSKFEPSSGFDIRPARSIAWLLASHEEQATHRTLLLSPEPVVMRASDFSSFRATTRQVSS